MLSSLLSSARRGSFVQQTVGRKGSLHRFPRTDTAPGSLPVRRNFCILLFPLSILRYPKPSGIRPICPQSGRCSVRSAPHFVTVRIQNVPKAGHKHSFCADSNRRLDRSFPFRCVLYQLSYRSHGRELNPRHHNSFLTSS